MIPDIEQPSMDRGMADTKGHDHKGGCCEKKAHLGARSDKKTDEINAHHHHHEKTHMPSSGSSSPPKTSLPTQAVYDSMPPFGLCAGLRAAAGFAARRPLPFLALVCAVASLMYAGYCNLWPLVFYHSKDCYFGLFMRVLMGRNVIILLDGLYVHVLCYGIVPTFRLPMSLTVQKIAALRIRNKRSMNPRIMQTLMVFAPLLYFYLDNAEGCNIMCCAESDASTIVETGDGTMIEEDVVMGGHGGVESEMVPEWYANYSVVCTFVAIPLLVFVINSMQDPVENTWLKQQQKRFGGHKHGSG